jgi:uncharacterized protein YbjT (DUF2867 family)
MILVAGGTGTLGRELTRLLLDRDLEVRILARETADVGSDIDVIAGDVRNPSDVRRAMIGVDTVVSAITGFGPTRDVSSRTVDGEGNSHLIAGAAAAGVTHFVLLSVRQASPDHPIELFRIKYRAEEELKESGLAWTIVRPTAYAETWLRFVAAPLAERGRTRIFGRGDNPNNFVSVRDAARLVDVAVAGPDMHGVTVEIGGPDNVGINGLVEAFSDITGAHGKVSHVPVPMLRAMSVLMRPVNPSIAELTAAAIVMDTCDMTFDPSAFIRAYPSVPLASLEEIIRRDYA